MDSREIVNYICPKCGHNKSYKNISKYSVAGECVKCGELTFYEKVNEYDLPKPPPTVECPYCHSKRTKKISTASKAGSIALFGIFALGKTTKQWHCNDCKSDF